MVTGPWLLVIFVFSIGFVLISIMRFHLNPFIALLLTSILTALLVGMPIDRIGDHLATGFGNTLKGIGIVIGLGIVLGRLLSESGATRQIAHSLLNRVGARNATLAVTLSGYLVSTSVFMDAAFVILIPIIRKMAVLSRKSLLVLISALVIGLIITHNMMIPTPGPVGVVANMEISIGLFMIYALVASLPAALVVGWLYSEWLGRRMTLSEQQTAGSEEPEGDEEAPSGRLSFLILLLPLVLIFVGSILELVLAPGTLAHDLAAFIGDKNIALLISVAAALAVFKKYIKSMSDVLVEATERSGLILLVTGAGGAFGYIISQSGIGAYLIDLLSGWNISLLVTGFLLSAILRAAQGSATVALITASSILGPLALQTATPPILVALAVCAGGCGLSLPNDSGFWVISRFANFTVNQTLKVWTLGASLAGLVAFAVILLLNLFAGILPGLH